MKTLRTDYAAFNARGVQVRTFNDLPHARAWVRNNAVLHEGLHLQEVSLVARKIYTPRSRPAPDFSIPVFA
jgi:hypothetical protein